MTLVLAAGAFNICHKAKRQEAYFTVHLFKS